MHKVQQGEGSVQATVETQKNIGDVLILCCLIAERHEPFLLLSFFVFFAPVKLKTTHTLEAIQAMHHLLNANRPILCLHASMMCFAGRDLSSSLKGNGASRLLLLLLLLCLFFSPQL